LTDQILKILGIVGSGVSRDTLTPMMRGPAAGEEATQAWDRAGVVQNPEIWSVYGTYMSQPETLDQQMQLWHEMAGWDLVAAALGEISEEATQPDFVTGHTLWFESTDKGFEKDLMKLRDALRIEEHLPSQIWHVAGYGNNFEHLHYETGQGVTGMSFAHPIDVRRYWLAKNRQCVGFNWKQESPPNSTAMNLGDSAFVRGVINSGANVPKSLWFPWDMLHMRRMTRSRINEHGEPIFKEAQGVYKKLRLALDQMIVHRLQIQPDRYIVKIDTADQPPAEQMRTVQRWQQMMRKKLSFGPGQSPANLAISDFRSQYDPMALDSVLWLPMPRNRAHAVDKLNGTLQVPDVFDIDMLLKLFFSIMGMPLSWLGITNGGDGAQQPASGKALLAQDMRFLRKTRSVRKPVIDQYTWMCYFHALLLNKDVDNLNITARMSDISGLEDQIRLELLNAQMDLLDKLGTALGNIGVPSHVMVDLVFRRYMRLPDDVVNAVITALPDEMPAQNEGVSDALVTRVHQIMGGETRLPNQIRKLMEVLGKGENEMRAFINKSSRVEVMDRLPRKALVKSLMEARDNDVSKPSTVLMEWVPERDASSMPAMPRPAVAGPGNSDGVTWRKYYH
jgi:hypothetical protein